MESAVYNKVSIYLMSVCYSGNKQLQVVQNECKAGET